MSLIDFLIFNKKNTASIAKSRLINLFKKEKNNSYYIDQLKKDLLKVISKYVKIVPRMISINLYNEKNNISILELSIKISEVKFLE